MLFGGVSGNQIQQYMDPASVCLFKQVNQVLIRSISGRCLLIVADVISGIVERRVEAGIDPQSIASKVFDVIQLRYNPLKISDTICVAVAEGLRVDLIKYSIFQPSRHIWLLS